MSRGRGAVILVDPIATGEPFLRAARRRGLDALAVSTVPEEMVERLGGARIRAEAARHVCAHDEGEAIRRLGDVSHVRAVVPATEPGVDLAESLGARLGLRSNNRPPGARRDKALMREAARAAGLRVPDFRRCSTWEDVERFAARRRGALVVKTPRGAGTCQVYVCADHDQLRASFERCLRSVDPFGHRPKFVVVEEYVGGVELAVNLFALRGDVRVVDVWSYEKRIGDAPAPVYLAAVQRDRNHPDLREAVDYAVRVCRALGVETGPAHVEIKVDANGPVLIELGARLCGARVPELWARFSDVDPFDVTLGAFLDELPSNPQPRFAKHLAVAFCPVWRAVREVREVKGWREIERLPSFFMGDVNARVGAPFEATTDMESPGATVWLAHEDPVRLLADVREVHNLFELEDSLSTRKDDESVGKAHFA